MSLKAMLLQRLRDAGIGLSRVPRGQVLPPEVPDLDCYTPPEDHARLFRPWRTESFQRLLTSAVRENTMLFPQKLYTLRQLLLCTLHLDGDVFEAGTCSGGTALFLMNAAEAAGVRKTFWLLDTFAGYQKVDAARDGRHVRVADCRGKSALEVEALLSGSRQTARLVPGLIPESLAQVAADRLCFAHIDVNLHEPTAASTEFCMERLLPGGVIVFDDYNWPATFGARRAIDEVTRRWKHEVVSLPESTQAFLIRKP